MRHSCLATIFESCKQLTATRNNDKHCTAHSSANQHAVFVLTALYVSFNVVCFVKRRDMCMFISVQVISAQQEHMYNGRETSHHVIF